MMSVVSMLGMFGMFGCEDRMDIPRPSTGEGKSVEVSLCVGIADEVDAASLGGGTSATKAGEGSENAFDVRLVSATQTKANGTDVDALSSAKPDQLHNLQILQYDSSNGFLALTPSVNQQAIGSTLSFSLRESSNCQLIFIARGSTSAVPEFSGSPSWSDLQARLADAATINGLTDINAMPYVLHLKDVNVTSDGKIQSPDGQDVRVLLKRLAARLTINWSFHETMTRNNYTLKEVRLCQVPSAYRIFPQTEEDPRCGTIYPTSIAEYKDLFRLKGGDLTAAGNTKTVWVPANAKGNPSNVTSVYYRTKQYAHSSATYVELVVDNTEKNERLYYRAYLGGNAVSDFNLLENTNYIWNININNADYTSDYRIQLLDQTPVISANLVSTSNCLMMRPGTNICFNPYLHEAGASGVNTYLSGKTIGSVRVLWQNKDAGTSGDLVMGYAVSNEAGNYNHTNLVNCTDIGDPAKARVHVKIPVTQGGNAVIAAYAADGATILWSWHIWATSYVPAALSGTITEANREQAIQTARKASAGGTVHTYNGTSWTQASGAFFNKVIMDRNLGAIRSTFSSSSDLDAARSYGNLYQWGRKDPMPGSVDGSSEEIGIIFDGDGVALPEITKTTEGDLEKCIQNPLTFYKGITLDNSSWGPASKTIYDPCPKGWKVPDFYNSGSVNDMFQGFGYGTTNLMIYFKGQWYSSQQSQQNDNGARNGFMYMYPGESAPNNFTDKSVWFPSTRLREAGSGVLRGNNPSMTMFSARTGSKNDRAWYTEMKSFSLATTNSDLAGKGYGMSVRCVQDRSN